MEIIVSDNASMDGSVDRIAATFADDSRVRILHNARNLGFGTACNRAAAVAAGDVLLILNPDCRLETDTIRRLHDVIASDDHIGIVGATIVDGAGVYEPASRRRDPLMRRAVMTMLGGARFEARSSFFTGAALPKAESSSAIEDVDAISGALMLIRRRVFDGIAGFDEGYFLHCEDLDLCRRARDAGARVVCANDIRVVHRKGTSSRTRPIFVARHKHRGMWRWFTKFDPAARNPLLRGMVWVGLWTHFALLRARLFFRGVSDSD